jgi:hypothetical protein
MFSNGMPGWLKRGKFTIAALLIAVVGGLVYQYWYKRVPEGCAPVVELLDFNQKQSKVIKDMSAGDKGGMPSADELRAYTAWADGLADRAGKVTDPKFVQQSVEVATSANDFVGKLRQVSATPHAPGAPTPVAVYEMSILNDRISADLAALTKACKP